ncbi:hypothetical protein C8Q80DRAFT_1119250 [Daedaleopsis nitida]|nr:hypothetical protein C8Q80DRAFT_1119250 [Daedaleopsis nitida]
MPDTRSAMAKVADAVAAMPLSETHNSRLKAQIALHTAKAFQLRAELLNATSLSSVAKLPPEVLIEIFLVQAAILRKELVDLHVSDRADIHQSFSKSYNFKWIRVSHIYRHWRKIALSYAALWKWVALEA